MAAVERADPHSQGNVVAVLAPLKLQLLDQDLASCQAEPPWV
jgi:hypothetical protein